MKKNYLSFTSFHEDDQVSCISMIKYSCNFFLLDFGEIY